LILVVEYSDVHRLVRLDRDGNHLLRRRGRRSKERQEAHIVASTADVRYVIVLQYKGDAVGAEALAIGKVNRE